MEGTAMWEVSLAAPEGECNIGLTYSVENTTYVRNIMSKLKMKRVKTPPIKINTQKKREITGKAI